MIRKHMKINQTSLIIRESQIKMEKYHFTPLRMSIVTHTHELTLNSLGEDVEKTTSLYAAAGNVKWCRHYEK